MVVIIVDAIEDKIKILEELDNSLNEYNVVVDGYKIEYIDGEFKSTGTGDCDIALESTPEKSFKRTY